MHREHADILSLLELKRESFYCCVALHLLICLQNVVQWRKLETVSFTSAVYSSKIKLTYKNNGINNFGSETTLSNDII